MEKPGQEDRAIQHAVVLEVDEYRQVLADFFFKTICDRRGLDFLNDVIERRLQARNKVGCFRSAFGV